MKKHDIHVIARAVIRVDNHVLVARCKGARNTFLPGGHVENGERMHDTIARELHEEFGERSVVGDYIGAIEHSFSEDGVTQHEINHLFRVELPNVTRIRPMMSLESHLEFFWQPIGSLGSINLAPPPAVAFIQSTETGVRWASTLRGKMVGEPNNSLKSDAAKPRTLG